MRTLLIAVLASMLLLASCNLPTSPTAAPTEDYVATQVAVLLTTMPTATVPPTQTEAVLPTDTPPPPQATATPEPPTMTPTATVTTEASAPDWRDPLDGGKAFYQFENENTRVKMENGALVLTAVNANGWHGWSLTFSQKPQNFRLEAPFVTQICSGGDTYGLVFRAPNGSAGYFFGLTCDGRYLLSAKDFEDGSNVPLIDPTWSSAIQNGENQSNRLEVVVQGNKIQLFANGTLLQELDDDTFAEAGHFGAYVAAENTPGFTVKMEEISLWKLP